jgi:hypothetical protein
MFRAERFTFAFNRMNRLRKISLKYFLIRAFLPLIFLTITWNLAAQRTGNREFDRPLTVRPDSAGTSATDTIPRGKPDSLSTRNDTLELKIAPDAFESPIQYAAEDSGVLLVQEKRVLLYGKTKTEFEDITLTSPFVDMNQETKLLTAYNRRDSAGVVLDETVFTQAEKKYVLDTVRFNFETQKAITTNAITQDGEMFVHGESVKKVDSSVIYVKGGFLTTCNLDEPHFGFRADKIKLINKRVAVSGPARPEFEGVPVPVYVPFGFFPLNNNHSSGLLPPQFATNDQMGLGLEGLGYYKIINDYLDAKLYGNIYSYGSWSANLNPTYYKRYRYRGSFNFGLQKTKRNFKGDPDFTTFNTFSVNWSHSMDSKARPGVSFSANVNASSTRYNENVPNSPQLNFQNQLSSSITYSKTWIDKPFNLTLSANHNQNNFTRLVTLSLPDMGFTVNTLYPFQKKESVGSKKWYEQLGIAYNGNFRNSVSFYDTAFRLRNLVDTLQWGAQHNIPITLSLPAILDGAVVVAPSVSYSQVWLSQTFERRWNPLTEKLDTVVNKGFFMDQQASFGLGLNTALFGTFNFKNKNLVAIRHTMRPSIGFNYRPDLSSKYYYRTQINKDGYETEFSRLQGGIYSGYGKGRSGSISFQLDNNLEAKFRNKDSTSDEPTKKVMLIDGFGANTSYNMLADSLKLAPVNLYFRTNLFQKININANAILNPYQVDSLGLPIDRFAWEDGGFKLGRITSGSLSFSTSFQSKPRDEKKADQRQQELDQQLNDPLMGSDRQRFMDYMQQNPSEFVDFNIPWQFSLSYSLYFNEQFKPDYSGFEKIIRSSASFSGSFSLTPKWKFTMNGFYDFDTKKLQTFSMSINREMHCWQMAISVTPIGIYRFFNITISPKSGILQDLRINRTRSFFTGF